MNYPPPGPGAPYPPLGPQWSADASAPPAYSAPAAFPGTASPVPMAVQMAPFGVPVAQGMPMGAPMVMGAPVAQVFTNDPNDPLAGLDSLFIKQKVSFAEAITNGMCETRNRYKIMDAKTGRVVFIAEEESEDCQRCCCAPNHEARVKIYFSHDGLSRQALAFEVFKPFKCVGCFSCCDFCQPEVTMYKGGMEQNQVVGSVKMPVCGGCLKPVFDMNDGKGTKFAELTGPTCCVGSCCDSKFQVEKGGQPTASTIEKKGVSDLQSAATQTFTDATNFSLNFQAGATPEEKATLLAGLFMLDFEFFEDDGAFKCEGNGCSVKLCDLFCCGCKCPCKWQSSNN